jgi:predicted nucleotidyltransferase
MRLSKDYRCIIKENTLSIFGKNSKVYLFGSRTDDSKKGGDIDLFVEPDDRNDLLSKKIKYLAKLNMLLGEQKIDVIILKNGDTLIEKIAVENGILL